MHIHVAVVAADFADDTNTLLNDDVLVLQTIEFLGLLSDYVLCKGVKNPQNMLVDQNFVNCLDEVAQKLIEDGVFHFLDQHNELVYHHLDLINHSWQGLCISHDDVKSVSTPS